MVGRRVEVEARMLGLDSGQVALVDGVFKQLAHELELLGQPGRMLKDELGWSHLDSKDVDVFAELVNGVYGVSDLEEQLAELEVDHAGHRFNLEDVCVVESDVQQAQVGLFVVPGRNG